MESLNSKEKSKKTWQFIFIFFALALLPVAAIFFSYRELPRVFNDEDKSKIQEYSKFARNQESLIKELNLIDSNFVLLANKNTNMEPSKLTTPISLANEKIKSMDSSELIKVIYRMVNNHMDQMRELQTLREEMNHSQKKNELLEKANAIAPQSQPVSTSAPGPGDF